MTIRSKMLALSLVTTLVAFALAGLIAFDIHLVSRESEDLDRVTRFSRSIRQAESLATEILLDGGARPLSQWKSLLRSLETQLLDLRRPSISLSGLREELTARLSSMDRAFQRLATTSGETPLTARTVLVSQLRANKDALTSRIDELEQDVRAAQSRTYRRIIIAQVIAVIVLLGLGATIYIAMRRFLVTTLDDLSAAIVGIGSGKLSEPIKTRRRDEIGALLRHLDAMRRQLNDLWLREDLARRKVEELSLAKSRFIASVSHELRTPLTALLGRLDLAGRRDDPAEIRRDVADARSAGNDLLSLINQVLDFSSIEANRIQLSAVPFDPDRLVKHVETVFATQAASKGLSLTIESTGDPAPSLTGDPKRLTQILFNLVGNAVKFTPRGTVSIRYGVEPIDLARCRLTIDVGDTGPGIPASSLNEIFEDFARISGAGRAAVGTGLGLAICARLIRAMGGTIDVESEVGLGSCFRVTIELPRALEMVTGVEESSRATARPSRSLTLLLAEDVEINRDIIATYLETEGHRVVGVRDGEECLERLDGSVTFDAILMDVDMPVMDGVEATSRIRAGRGPLREIPIIGLTANAFQEQRERYLEAGMTACHAKPIDWDTLLGTLADLTGTADTGRVSLDPGRAHG